MKRALATALAVLVLATAAIAWVPDLTTPDAGGTPVRDHWNFTAAVNWNLNPAHGANISGTRSLAEVMQAAFNTWITAPNATIIVARGLDSTASSETASPSNINLICFVCADADFTKDSTTLAVTITTTSTSAGSVGQIVKADIIFNPADNFNTDGTGSDQDLQVVAVHEIGHFLGLDHSGVVRSAMFPAASDVRDLSYDDAAGIAATYPSGAALFATGSISGTVRSTSGIAVFGAHVYAESNSSASGGLGAAVRKTPVGTLTGPDGSYTISGLPPDTYVVTAEPLDGPVSDSDVSGYASAFGKSAVQTGFTTRSH